MNVEHLSAIAEEYLADLSRTGVAAALHGLADTIGALSNDPNEENQRNFAISRKALRTLFDDLKPFQYRRTWQNSLMELGLDPLLDSKPLAVIESTIDENQMALTMARDVIQQFEADIKKFETAFQSVIAGLSIFEFHRPTTGPDQGLLSILVPLSSINSDLAKFALEMKFFDRDIGTIVELATGSQPTRTLLQLSTSNPLVLISAAPAAVLLCLQIVTAIQDIRLKQIELQTVMASAAQAGYTSEVLEPMKAQHDAVVEDKIAALVTKIIKENISKKHSKTVHEWTKPVSDAVNRMATRIDHGYQYEGDVRKEFILDEEGKPEQRDIILSAQIADDVSKLTEKIQHAEIIQKPVLGLPAPHTEDDTGTSPEIDDDTVGRPDIDGP